MANHRNEWCQYSFPTLAKWYACETCYELTKTIIWTEKKPDREGWWWVEAKKFNERPFLARVYFIEMDGSKTMLVEGLECMRKHIADAKDIRWSSAPIPVPKEQP